MTESIEERNLYDYYKVVAKRKNLIILIIFVITIFSFLLSIFSQKVYESVSVVRIPIIDQTTQSDNKSQTQVSLVSYTELKLIIENYESKNSDKIVNLGLTEIQGSTRDYRLIVRAKSSPEMAVKVSNELLNYFKKNKFSKNKIKKKKALLTKKISNISRTLKEAVKIKNISLALLESKNSMGFNPVELETKINELENNKMLLESQLKSLEEFEFVREPLLPKEPSAPKPTLNTLLSFVASLFMGIFVALVLDWKDGIKEN